MLRCTACKLSFDADDPRCPTCLRRTTIEDPNAPKLADGLARPPFSWPGFAARTLAGATMVVMLSSGSLHRLGLLDSDVGWITLMVASLFGGAMMGAVWTAFPRTSPMK